MTRKRADPTKRYQQLLENASSRPRHVLRLYITGTSPRSLEALAAIESLCREHLEGRYSLEVIDVYEHPELAKDAQITALPMLVRKLPPSLRRLVGNLSDTEHVLVGLDLRPTKA